MSEYRFRLYVLEGTPKSDSALRNLRRIWDAEIPGRYDVEVIDVQQHPERAEEDRVLATPTLIKLSPSPVFRIVGDMSATEKVLLGLGLGPARGLPRGVDG